MLLAGVLGFVLLLAVLAGGGLLWLSRSNRASQEELQAALAVLRAEVGAPAAPAPIAGAWRGRACWVGRTETRGTDVPEWAWSRVTVAVQT